MIDSVANDLRAVVVLLKERQWWKRHYAAVFFDPTPKQKRCIASKAHEKILSGGKRAGKSDGLAHDLALSAWGIKGLLYPGFPADGAKRRFWAVALSGDKQRDTLRPKLDAMLGPRARWREADKMYVLPNGSTITLKTQEADLDKFQSADLHGIWIDEVGDDHAKYKEMKARLTDHVGWIMTSMTPTKGVNWMHKVYRRWKQETLDEERESADGTLFVFMDALANPYLPPKGLRNSLDASLTPEDYDVARYGRFVELRGLVFPMFSYERHVVNCLDANGRCSMPPPAEWPRWRGMDFGHAAPSTCVWVAKDPREKEFVLYRELYDRGRSTVQDLCERILGLSADERYELTVLDPSCWRQDPHRDAIGRWHRISDDYERFGVEVHRGNNDVAASIELMSQLFGREGKQVRLRIHACCRNGIEEIEGLHWKDGVLDGGTAERIGGEDHFWDGARYALMAATEGDYDDGQYEALGTGAEEPNAAPLRASARVRMVPLGDGKYRYEAVYSRGTENAEEFADDDPALLE